MKKILGTALGIFLGGIALYAVRFALMGAYLKASTVMIGNVSREAQKQVLNLAPHPTRSQIINTPAPAPINKQASAPVEDQDLERKWKAYFRQRPECTRTEMDWETLKECANHHVRERNKFSNLIAAGKL